MAAAACGSRESNSFFVAPNIQTAKQCAKDPILFVVRVETVEVKGDEGCPRMMYRVIQPCQFKGALLLPSEYFPCEGPVRAASKTEVVAEQWKRRNLSSPLPDGLSCAEAKEVTKRLSQMPVERKG